jgi:hypothetical protein
MLRGETPMSIYNQSTSNDLVQFVQFAVRHLGSDAPKLSPEELLQQWRANGEYLEAVEDIRRSHEDRAAGRVQSVADAFRDIRRDLGIAK